MTNNSDLEVLYQEDGAQTQRETQTDTEPVASLEPNHKRSFSALIIALHPLDIVLQGRHSASLSMTVFIEQRSR